MRDVARRWARIAVVAAIVGLSAVPPVVAVADTRPNVLLIVTDDQRLQGTMMAMPKTLSLFDQGGTEFTNPYTATPLCCPARGSIRSGRYAHNHGVHTNKSQTEQLAFDQSKTIENTLQQAGYSTALVGKYWNDWPLETPPPHFDRFAMFRDGYSNANFNVNGTIGRVSGYSTTVLGRFVDQFLTGFEQNDDRPWYLYLTPHAPHSPFVPDTQYANTAFPDLVPSPAFTETDRSDKPAQVRNLGHLYTVTEADAVRKDQLRTLISVDDLVSVVFARLAALGETNTLAIFTSDNGYLWGEHGLDAKRWPYADSIRIPLYLRWPGHVAAGADDPRLVSHVDIAPTIYEATGSTPSYTPDGASLFSSGARQRLFLEYFLSPDSKVKSWVSTVTPTYQYVEWWENGAVFFREYYNLVADPYQLTNLLGDGNAANDPNVTALSAQLALDKACSGTACPQPVGGARDTQPPGPAGRPTASSAAAGQVTLTWAAADDDVSSVITYRIYRDGAANPFASTSSASTTTVTFTDTGLQGGSVHTYSVQPVDQGGNVGPRTAESAPVTVMSGSSNVFADDFSSGLGAWTTVAGLTIDSVNGSPAPSARAQANGTRAYASKTLGATYGSLCITAAVNVASIGASQTFPLLRLKSSATAGIARVYINASRALKVKNDVGGTQVDAGATLPTGWHSLQLCATVGTSGQVRLLLDGVQRASWSTTLGTTPIAAVQILDDAAKTFTANVDQVVVAQP